MTDEPQGMFKDFRRLKQDGGASAEELREFLGKLRGRSPQEMLGIVTTSGLIQGMVIATVGILGVLFVFTVGPWVYTAMAGEDPRQVTKDARPAVETGPVAEPAAATAAATAPVAGDPAAPDPAAATRAMGIDETKAGVPDIDKLIDKVLDD